MIMTINSTQIIYNLEYDNNNSLIRFFILRVFYKFFLKMAPLGVSCYYLNCGYQYCYLGNLQFEQNVKPWQKLFFSHYRYFSCHYTIFCIINWLSLMDSYSNIFSPYCLNPENSSPYIIAIKVLFHQLFSDYEKNGLFKK